MRNPIRLVVIVLLSLMSLNANAQQIFVAGVKKTTACEFALRPLLADLQSLNYPRDWWIVIACNRPVWQQLQRKADAGLTKTAFTNVKGRITVVNGEIYRESLPLRGTMHRNPKLVLKHELGHILCECEPEQEADRWIEMRD